MSDDKKLDDKVVEETMEAEAKKVEAERANITEGEVVESAPAKDQPVVADDSAKPAKGDDKVAIELVEKQDIPAYKTVATDVMNPVAYQQIKLLATDLIKAEAMPQGIKNAEQAFVVMWTGREMGMTPFESINALYIVNGAVRIFGKAVPGQMRKHGYNVEYSNETDAAVTARVYRNTVDGQNEEFKETYTFAEAEKSGYTKSSSGLKFGWKEGANRRLKLRYGALSLILRTYIPDVLGPIAGIVEVDEDVDISSTKETIEQKKARLAAKLNIGKEATDDNN
jgi:hypothetical protein